MDYILLTLAFILMFVGLSFLLPPFFGIISPIPSTPQMNRLLIQKIKQYDESGSVIVDIGSGYGGTIRALAQAFPNRLIIGCEFSFFPRWVSRLFLMRSSNVQIVSDNGFDYVKSHPDVTSAYYYFPLNRRAKKRVSDLLEHFNGTVFANTYPHPDFIPTDETKAGDVFKSVLYVYAGKRISK